MSPTPSEWRCPASFCFPPVCYDKLTRWPTPAFLPDPDGLSWESSSWEKQREEVTEHLCQGGLHQDSIYQGYTLDDQNTLLQWSNLQPTCWAPEQGAEAVPPADCPGYYQVTILGKEITPVACSVSHATVRASRAALNAWVRMHLRLLRTRAGKFYFVAQSGFYCTTFMLVLSSFKLQLCFIRNHVTFKHQELKKRSLVKPSLLLLSTGINKQIAVDAAYFPIVSTADPRAVGLPQDPHGNTMFSSLSSGFLCPLSDPASPSDVSLPEPGRRPRGWAWHYTVWQMMLQHETFVFTDEVLATASELEDTHVVCILDLCHLGVDKVELLISKVYRVTELRSSEEVNKCHLLWVASVIRSSK